MACETHPTSPSPADSSGCRRQTAEHPEESEERVKRRRERNVVENLKKKKKSGCFHIENSFHPD